MKQSDRGMVKYAPYQSLVEQASYLAKMRARRQKVEKKLLAEEEAEEINDILVHYDDEPVSLTYWENGIVYERTGVIFKIDATRRRLNIEGTWIDFSSLQSLKRK